MQKNSLIKNLTLFLLDIEKKDGHTKKPITKPKINSRAKISIEYTRAMLHKNYKRIAEHITRVPALIIKDHLLQKEISDADNQKNHTFFSSRYHNFKKRPFSHWGTYYYSGSLAQINEYSPSQIRSYRRLPQEIMAGSKYYHQIQIARHNRINIQNSSESLQKLYLRRHAAFLYWTWLAAGEKYKQAKLLYEKSIHYQEKLKKEFYGESFLKENENILFTRESFLQEAQTAYEEISEELAFILYSDREIQQSKSLSLNDVPVEGFPEPPSINLKEKTNDNINRLLYSIKTTYSEIKQIQNRLNYLSTLKTSEREKFITGNGTLFDMKIKEQEAFYSTIEGIDALCYYFLLLSELDFQKESL